MTTLSTSAFYDTATYNMTQLSKQTAALQTQISTGDKVQYAYQNPVVSAQMRALTQADTLATANTANTNVAKTQLTQADDTLSQFTNIVSSIQTLATQAASATLTDQQRSSIGTQINSYYQNLVSLANTKDASGNALFGGQEGSGDAYTLDSSGNATYAGTSSAPTLSLGQGLTVTTGVTGPEFLNYTSGGQSTNLLSVVKNLATTLQSGSSSSGTNSGTSALATAANSALTQLSDGLNAITTAQTVVGARLSWVNTTSAIQTQQSTLRAQQESNIGGTDITSTVAQLQETMTVLQASQASFVKVSGLSLFSMLS
ncbi:MAG TPA: flagellar biosynthesis protein FlgL [Novosphingobium sp.]|nr:flagellar biosynthesis protein FlgL [Novosphingobium sp.]